MLPFDLHVLGMPPAFNLSQDQTLQFNLALLVSFTSLYLKVPTRHPHSLSLFLLINSPPGQNAYSTDLVSLVKIFLNTFTERVNFFI